MDTLRHLLSKIIFVIPLVILTAIIYWSGTKLIKHLPGGNFSFSNIFSADFLPAPIRLEKPTTTKPDDDYLIYSDATKGNKFYNDFINNLNNNTKNVSNQTMDGNVGNINKFPREKYIRNLSIFDNGHIYTGITFTGEAKNTMFSDNGTFSIIVIDPQGRVVAVDQAVAIGSIKTAGFVQFKSGIKSVLPNKIPCHLVFQAGPGSFDGFNRVFVAVPEICN